MIGYFTYFVNLVVILADDKMKKNLIYGDCWMILYFVMFYDQVS